MSITLEDLFLIHEKNPAIIFVGKDGKFEQRTDLELFYKDVLNKEK